MKLVNAVASCVMNRLLLLLRRASINMTGSRRPFNARVGQQHDGMNRRTLASRYSALRSAASSPLGPPATAILRLCVLDDLKPFNTCGRPLMLWLAPMQLRPRRQHA